MLEDSVEKIGFAKLNKTIDLFDLMKPQYEKLINKDLVKSWKIIDTQVQDKTRLDPTRYNVICFRYF